MHIVLFDDAPWRNTLLPLAFTRPVSDLRVGTLTIAEKWGKWMDAPYSFITPSYLSSKYPLFAGGNDFLVIRGNVLPEERLCGLAAGLEIGQGLKDADGTVLFRTDRSGLEDFRTKGIAGSIGQVLFQHPIHQIRYPEDLFMQNGEQLRLDFGLLTKGRNSAGLSPTNRVLGDQIFVEEGVEAECSVFNSTTGPIYLGRNSEVWEGCHIRGAFSLAESSQVKMGARIYGNVSVGPYSRVGGEMNTCVIWGYSSKGHEGYLGSSVMGQWCNWGADTNNSNLKNNYKNVKIFDYISNTYRDSGLQFYGLIMADHAKCAINTAFNTGTVVGVGASVFGAGFPPTFVPDFSWGGSGGLGTHRLESMFETAALVYERRDQVFDETEKEILEEVFARTSLYRDPSFMK